MTVFIDANVVIHATGTDAALRSICAEICRHSVRASARPVTSAEVLQEILWVRQRTRGLESARLALELATQAFDVTPLFPEDILVAASYPELPGLQARDRIHFAVMERLGISRIVSTDRAFDSLRGITRLDPADFATWKQTVFPGAS
ncbi:MAG: type II toxin-antitoxin system VapC family toxin [Dehalococcoidia bacterium]|nr:type II toxin-antitoxin system VapC family toxin [Dehalococcoidia bacterium]